MPSIPCPDTKPPYPTGSWKYVTEAVREKRRLPPPAVYKEPIGAEVRLHVAVVGAGVGGLASAIALRRDGHEVHVYEDAPKLSEIGAGIQIPPNSVIILHNWGLEDSIRKRSVEPNNLYWKRWQDGRIIARTQYRPFFREWFGAPYYVIHRAHLHEALHEKAVELGVRIHLGATVAKYDPERPAISFENGDIVKPDLLIACDGLKSSAREIITGRKVVPRSHGFAAYRACVPVEEMKRHPIISDHMEMDSNYLWVGGDTHVMSYSIAGGRDWNMVITVPESREPCSWDEWDSTDLDKMKSFYKGWDPTLTALLNLVKETRKWPVQDIEQIETWTSKNKTMILLGDAAHAMLPAMVQGASMAVEDACALAQALRLMRSKADLARAITAWEDARHPRATAMQEASLRHMYTLHVPDGAQQRARDAGMHAEVTGEHFVESPNQWSDPTTQRWAFMHDPAEAVRKVWGHDEEQIHVPGVRDSVASVRARL